MSVTRNAYTQKWDEGRVTRIITKVAVSAPHSIQHVLDDTQGPEPPQKIKIVTYNALWDTGASATFISKKVSDELQLSVSGRRLVNTATQKDECSEYLSNIYLPNRIIVPFLPVTHVPNTGDLFDVIIGMDIITLGDFAITNIGGKTTMSFRIPSSHTIDYMKEHENNQASLKSAINRNDPCYCGSGKKFKNCHKNVSASSN